jgi:hypothetical protein
MVADEPATEHRGFLLDLGVELHTAKARPRCIEGGLGEWNNAIEVQQLFGWDLEDGLRDYEEVAKLEVLHYCARRSRTSRSSSMKRVSRSRNA